jgi:pimeloyl-ACP methyl ester carboxylesterase
MSDSEVSLGPPSSILALLEMRALTEYLSAMAAMPLLDSLLPRGDCHPVIVVPGFMGTRKSTLKLRRTLAMLGYQAFDWQLGRNIGPVGQVEDQLSRRVAQVCDRTGKKPTLIGWSLGGVYARILAHREPDSIRSIITLGSPVRFPHQSTADKLYQRISGQLEHPEHLNHIAAAPPIPASAIYTRLDGIVNWRACLAEQGALAENIRVYGSHCGLGHHPLVLWLIAERLAQPSDQWERFSWRRALQGLQAIA